MKSRQNLNSVKDIFLKYVKRSLVINDIIKWRENEKLGLNYKFENYVAVDLLE